MASPDMNSLFQVMGVPGPWGGNPIRGLTPIVTGEGDYQTTWPISGDLTNIFGQFLGSQVGGGASPYNLPVNLPGGGQSQPGQLTADPNQQLTQFLDFLGGGSPQTPGQGTFLDAITSGLQAPLALPKSTYGMLESGMPIDQLPAWQAMIEAQRGNVARGGRDIQEAFGAGGAFFSSGSADTLTNYYNQVSRDQNALLGKMTAEAQEAAKMRQYGTGLGVAELATGLGENAANRRFLASNIANTMYSQLGQIFQGMDQAAIDRTLNEFIRTRPEYGPLLQYILALSTVFPPTQQNQPGGILPGILSAIGDVIQIAGPIAGVIGGGPTSGGGGTGLVPGAGYASGTGALQTPGSAGLGLIP